MKFIKKARWIVSWVLVRPRRWFFQRMAWNGDLRLRWKKSWDGRWIWPNPHWWTLHWSVFAFCRWLCYDAWRPLSKWGDRGLVHKPWYAAAVQRIGQTTAGYAISGYECFHCASPQGCQVDLSDDETGTVFRLLETWSVDTADGTDYRFRGITTCPKCGYEAEYEDGSL